jgi:hypothetical protein
VQPFSLTTHPRNSSVFTAGDSKICKCEAGWQTILRIASGESSPSGNPCAVTALAWHITSSRTGGLQGTCNTEIRMAFALASGPVGVVDLCPDGDRPCVYWSKVLHKDPIGVLTFKPRPRSASVILRDIRLWMEASLMMGEASPMSPSTAELPCAFSGVGYSGFGGTIM